MGERVLEDCGKLKLVRDHIVDWVLLESDSNPSEEFSNALIDVLERLIEFKSRPPELDSWDDTWFEAHGVFAYETFLYIVAALMEAGAFRILHRIFTSSYLLPETEVQGSDRFGMFDRFCFWSRMLQIPAPQEPNERPAPAKLIKCQADRTDLPFPDIMQAELLVLMMTFITDDTCWVPLTLHYALPDSLFPFFQRAAQHRNFQKLATITGIDSVDQLREAMIVGRNRLEQKNYFSTILNAIDVDIINVWNSMNMDTPNTIR